MITRSMISFDVEKNKSWFHIQMTNGVAFQDAFDALTEVIDELKNIQAQQQAIANDPTVLVPPVPEEAQQ